MKNGIKITSVNLGKRKKFTVGNKIIETGIFKQPVLDKVKVSEQGLVNDVVADTSRHGGADQAIYIYSLEDYGWWSKELHREIAAGTFGENITLSSFGDVPLRIGDRFQVNQILMEVSFARVPCATLGARMGEQGFVKRFVRAGRPGVYARVLKTGKLQVGDEVKFIPSPDTTPTVTELYNLWHTKERNPEILRQGLKAPLAERARFAFQYWLDQSS